MATPKPNAWNPNTTTVYSTVGNIIGKKD